MRIRNYASASALVAMAFSIPCTLAACSGSDGATGPAGASGAAGTNGQAGAAGSEGAAGVTGEAGEAGAAGAQGAAGENGEAGASAPVPEAGTSAAPSAVYMLSNDTTENEIIEFLRAPDGTLSPFGSFSTGGAGGAIAEQGALTFDAATNRFYAVNAGDNSISLLHLETSGTIRLLSKIASGGVAPNSITFSGNTVYVLNSGSASIEPNITGFTVDPAGLVAIAGSTQPLSSGLTGTGPGGVVTNVGGSEILFMPSGNALVVTERLSNKIDTFAVSAIGVASAPVVFAEPGPVGATPGSEPFGFSVTAGGQIIVSEAWSGATGLSSTSTFSVASSGLTQISHSVPSGQSGACWTVVIGNDVYETNTASATLTHESVTATGTATVVTANSGAAGAPGTGPTDLAATSDGAYVYCHTGQGALSIFARAAADGSLIKSPDFVGIPTKAVGLVAR